jgi:hypothetical protein
MDSEEILTKRVPPPAFGLPCEAFSFFLSVVAYPNGLDRYNIIQFIPPSRKRTRLWR